MNWTEINWRISETRKQCNDFTPEANDKPDMKVPTFDSFTMVRPLNMVSSATETLRRIRSSMLSSKAGSLSFCPSNCQKLPLFPVVAKFRLETIAVQSDRDLATDQRYIPHVPILSATICKVEDRAAGLVPEIAVAEGTRVGYATVESAVAKSS